MTLKLSDKERKELLGELIDLFTLVDGGQLYVETYYPLAVKITNELREIV